MRVLDGETTPVNLYELQEAEEGQPLRVVPVLDRAPKRSRPEDEEDIQTFTFKITEPDPSLRSYVPVPPPFVIPPAPLPLAAQVKASDRELGDIIARATEAAEAAEAKRRQEEEEAEKARIAKAERKAKEKERLAAKKEKERERAKRKEKEKTRSGASLNGHTKPSSSLASTTPAASTSSASTKALDKDKRLLKLVGEVVVKHMSRYREQLDKDVFKKTAKDVRLSTSAISNMADIFFNFC